MQHRKTVIWHRQRSQRSSYVADHLGLVAISTAAAHLANLFCHAAPDKSRADDFDGGPGTRMAQTVLMVKDPANPGGRDHRTRSGHGHVAEQRLAPGQREGTKGKGTVQEVRIHFFFKLN